MRAERSPPVRIDGRSRRHVDARLAGRRGDQLVDHQFQHAVIEQAHEPEPLGDRHDLVGVEQAAVGALDAHQAFVEGGSRGIACDHRLVGQQDAPLVERGDDLVGRAHVLAAQRLALEVRPIGAERAAALGLGAASASCARARISRTVRAWRGAVTPPIVTVTATGPAAVAHDSSRTPASRRSAAIVMSSGVQFVQDDAELVAGEAAEMILAAHARAQALGDRAITSSATSKP